MKPEDTNLQALGDNIKGDGKVIFAMREDAKSVHVQAAFAEKVRQKGHAMAQLRQRTPHTQKVAEGVTDSLSLSKARDWILASLDNLAGAYQQGVIATSVGACVLGVLVGIVAFPSAESTSISAALIQTSQTPQVTITPSLNSISESNYAAYYPDANNTTMALLSLQLSDDWFIDLYLPTALTPLVES